MFRARSIIAASLAMLLAACGDISEPELSGQSALFAKGGRRSTTTASTDGGATEGTVQDSSSGSTSEDGIPHVLRFAPGAPSLMTYDTTFVAHQGWKQNFVIFFEDGNYFMVLDVPSSAQFVDADGNPVPDGESVEISVRVDGTYISFEFGPHGSSFTGKRPVVLWVWTKYADLDGVDGQPKVWYQPNRDSEWKSIPTTVDKAGQWLKAELRHFSNYAIAW